MDPEHITPEMIRSLGSQYLKKHPKHSFWHNNHTVARNLLMYQQVLVQSNKSTMDKTLPTKGKTLPSSKDHWMFLVAQYKLLKKPSGTLAGLIEGCFTSAFKFAPEGSKDPFPKSVKVGLFHQLFSHQDIVHRLSLAISTHFNPRIVAYARSTTPSSNRPVSSRMLRRY